MGQPCGGTEGACRFTGRLTCEGEATRCVPNEPIVRHDDVCDRIDNDCDGLVDEGGVCAAQIVRDCQVWLATHNRDRQFPQEALPVWGHNGRNPAAAPAACNPFAANPQVGRINDDVRCISSGGDGLFHSFPVAGSGVDFGRNDALGVAFHCQGQGNAIGAVVHRQCRVFLGKFGQGRGTRFEQDRCEDFGGEAAGEPVAQCQSLALDPGDAQCVGTFSGPNARSSDTNFHPLWITEPDLGLQGNTALGVSFVCEDPERVARSGGQWIGPTSAPRFDDIVAVGIGITGPCHGLPGAPRDFCGCEGDACGRLRAWPGCDVCGDDGSRWRAGQACAISPPIHRYDSLGCAPGELENMNGEMQLVGANPRCRWGLINFDELETCGDQFRRESREWGGGEGPGGWSDNPDSDEPPCAEGAREGPWTNHCAWVDELSRISVALLPRPDPTVCGVADFLPDRQPAACGRAGGCQ